MAWTTISDATLEVGKALRALTMRNLRDNITALANGDAGAPKVQTAAVQDGAVTTAKIAAGNVTTDRIASGAVAAWNASLGTGEIGTYAFLLSASGSAISAGTAYAGALIYAGVRTTPSVFGTGLVGGTWRAMGSIGAAAGQSPGTVFLRIA